MTQGFQKNILSNVYRSGDFIPLRLRHTLR